MVEVFILQKGTKETKIKALKWGQAFLIGVIADILWAVHFCYLCFYRKERREQRIFHYDQMIMSRVVEENCHLVTLRK